MKTIGMKEMAKVIGGSHTPFDSRRCTPTKPC